MSAVDALLNLFLDDEARQDTTQDPEAALGDISPEEFLQALPEVCEQLPPDQAAVVRAAYGIEAPEGAPELSEDVEGAIPPVPEDASTAELMAHYTQVVNISQQVEDEGDTIIIDQSVHQNIEAYGDVVQDFDNDVAAGDGSVVAGDGSQVNTGDGAVQAGGDMQDSTVATGDVAGSVTGDNDGSVVGDGNQVVSGSEVGAVAFGGGDASNLEAENANMGNGTLVSDTYGDATVNSGDGDLSAVEGSQVSESSIGGGGDVFSDDATVSAEEGSSVGFGEGSSSYAEDQDTTIDDNYGSVQVGGDGEQSSFADYSTDGSYNTEGSYDSSYGYADNSTHGSYNTDGSHNTDGSYEDNSFNEEYSDNSQHDDSWRDNSVSDDDGVDADVEGHFDITDTPFG